jgi:hypothetical protein
MKKETLYTFAATLLTLVSTVGCSDFLDRNPSSGIDKSVLFVDYTMTQAFLDDALFNLERQYVIDFMHNNRSHNSQLSDECATTANNSGDGFGQYRAALINSGNWLLTSKTSNDWELGTGVNSGTTAGRAARSIRVCNLVFENYGSLENVSQDDIDRLLGQAHMLRAWHYFELIRRFGGMPILDRPLADKEDADQPRVTYAQSHEWMMQDIEKAILLLPEQWDDNNVGRPNKMAARAFASMAALYAASPLMQNDLESTVVKPYDKAKAEIAAQYAWEVISRLGRDKTNWLIGTTGDTWKKDWIYWWPNSMQAVNPEHLWYNRQNHALGGTNGNRTFNLTPGGSSSQLGENAAMLPTPTLNFVNMFDKKGADGNYYPIVDTRAGYSLDDPYVDRDPRFYQFILYPGSAPYGQYAKAATLGDFKVNSNDPYYATTWVGGYDYQQFLTLSFTNIQSQMQTSFMHKKFHWPEATENASGAMRNGNFHHRTVFIRVAQAYLDFAEASFEATGSATAIVPGTGMSAEQAINTLRERWGLTPLAADIVADPDKFREAYRRERAVELYGEFHRWFDIRRWMIAHTLFNPTGPVYGVPASFSGNSPIWGMRTELKPGVTITKTSEIAPDKFTYTPYPMTNVVRVFAMRNYWYPFPTLEVASQTNLKQNPGW